MDRTDLKSDTELAQPRSRDVLPPSSWGQRAIELMKCAAELRGGTYVSPPPRVPRLSLKDRQRAEERAQEEHSVYFLYGCDRVKIGTAYHLRTRLEDLQSASPVGLTLVKTISGGRIMEARMHRRFDSARMHGEWFWLAPELRTFISEDNSCAGNLQSAEDRYRAFLQDELKHMTEKQR